MKIGILTIHDSPNYGACLQCFALWRYLDEQGYDCEIIDLHRPVAHSDYIPSKRYTRCRPQARSIKKTLKLWVKKILGKKQNNKEYYDKEAKKKFAAFNSLYKKSQPYSSIDAFYKNPPNYDIYIAGSDQLWNPTQVYCIEPYFLTFVNGKGKKKISFSTSIGITKLKETEKEKFKEWLNDFTAISVREKQAKELLESFIERDITQVADPTFLIDSATWYELAEYPSFEKPYILYFALHVDVQLLEYCKRLSKESGIELYVLNQIQPQPGNDEYIAIKDAGPREFLGYISKAHLVITDSFHGTVFSLIMGAQNFYTYIASGNKRGSRIEDLLELFSLKNHIIRGDFSHSYNDLQKDKPSQSHVQSIIKNERLKSVSFLKTAIEK